MNIDDHDIPIVPDLLLDIKRRRQLGDAVSPKVLNKIDTLNDELVVKATQHGTEHPIVLAGLYTLIDYYSEAHQYYIAERLLKRLQTAYKRTFKSPHISIARSLTRLGDILTQQIKYKESLAYYLESLHQYEQLINIETDLTIADTYQGLAVSYAQQREWESSELYYKKLLALYRKSYNEEHPVILETISSLTNVLEALGKFLEAEELCGSSLDNCIKILGEAHPVTQNASAALARVKLSNGHKEEAEQMYRQAIRYSSLSLGEEDDQTITLKYSLAQLLIQKHEYKESEQILHQVIRGQENNKGEYDKDTLGMYQYIGELYLLKLQVLSAREYFTKAYEGRKQVEGLEHPLTYASLFSIGKSYHMECYWRNQLNYRENLGKASDIIQSVHEGLFHLIGLGHPLCLEVTLYYGDFLLQYDRYEEAEKIFKRLSDYYHTILNPEEVIVLFKPSTFSRTSVAPSRASTREAQRRAEKNKKVLSMNEIIQFGEILYKLGVISEKLKKMIYAMVVFEKSYYLFVKAEKDFQLQYSEWVIRYEEEESQREIKPGSPKSPVTPSRSLARKAFQMPKSPTVSKKHVGVREGEAEGKSGESKNIKENEDDDLKYVDEEEELRRKQYEKIQTMKKESYEQLKHTEYINNL